MICSDGAGPCASTCGCGSDETRIEGERMRHTRMRDDAHAIARHEHAHEHDTRTSMPRTHDHDTRTRTLTSTTHAATTRAGITAPARRARRRA